MEQIRKIGITDLERIVIASSLVILDHRELACKINSMFIDADPANDGPEIAILNRQR